jgi:hypothetical protein
MGSANARTFYQTFNKDEYPKGIELLERAVDLDPEYASAWAWKRKRAQLEETLRLYPKPASFKVIRNYWTKKFKDPPHAEKIIAALRRAGVTE